jgi:deazaflavin-dependent oxidoreductase (nitroreductase family)
MAENWNGKVIDEFRANQGRVGGNFAGAPLLLLGTTGARTGEQRVNPMMYLDGGDRLYVFASFAGRPENPAWYHNLKANPAVTVEVGDEVYEATATELTGPERDEIFAEQARRYPGFAGYQEKTTRVIPVIALTRAGA